MSFARLFEEGDGFALATPFLLNGAGEDFDDSIGAGRFLPATGAGLANGSVEEAREPAMEGSFFRVETVGAAGGDFGRLDGGSLSSGR